MPGNYAHANWPCLQLLADWRLRKARERDLAVNFVVREEHLWSVARYMPGSLGELDSGASPTAKSASTVKRCWRWWKKRRHCRKRPYRSLMLNLMDMPGYRKAFKAIKSLITDVQRNAQDQRRIAGIASANQPTAELALETETANNLPGADFRLARGELMAEALHNLLQEYPQ